MWRAKECARLPKQAAYAVQCGVCVCVGTYQSTLSVWMCGNRYKSYRRTRKAYIASVHDVTVAQYSQHTRRRQKNALEIHRIGIKRATTGWSAVLIHRPPMCRIKIITKTSPKHTNIIQLFPPYTRHTQRRLGRSRQMFCVQGIGTKRARHSPSQQTIQTTPRNRPYTCSYPTAATGGTN